jgi:hypothetical protein
MYEYQLENPPVMTRAEAKTIKRQKYGPLSENSFFHTETYCVYCTVDHMPVQSDYSPGMAERSCSILNNHEIKNGRPGGYRWFQFAAPIQSV